MSEYQRGKSAARTLDLATVGAMADDLVLGGFSWMDWFDDKPSRAFLSGFTDEVMRRDHEWLE